MIQFWENLSNIAPLIKLSIEIHAKYCVARLQFYTPCGNVLKGLLTKIA